MSLLNKGHPLGFLLNRELNNVGPSWKPIVDTRFNTAKNFFRKNLLSHYGCVNAIEFSDDGRWLVSGGDDRRILVWDMHKAIHSSCEPKAMAAEHASNIFALALDYRSSRIFSGGNDDQVVVSDVATGTCLDYFVHEQPVYGLSTDPQNDNIFASACDDGRILIYDIREPASSDPFCLASTNAAFHSVMYNPREPRLIVTANFKKGVSVWDIRRPKESLFKYGGPNPNQCCMSARFNRDGSRILALRKRLPPVLYSTDSTVPLFQFNQSGYYNSCTMKSCCFAGSNDEFVLSGSDNFDLCMWKIPSGEPRTGSSIRNVRNAHLVLQGHRSIVNQVRYNHVFSVIASSGVEKLIKLWSPFSLPSSYDGRSSYKLRGDKERDIYSHEDYINLILRSGQFMSLTYDTSRRNTKEDPRMMAFFDALVQRDIKGISEEDGRVLKASYTNTTISFTSSSSNDEEAEPEQSEGDDEEAQDSPVEEENVNPISRSMISSSSSSNDDERIISSNFRTGWARVNSRGQTIQYVDSSDNEVVERSSPLSSNNESSDEAPFEDRALPEPEIVVSNEEHLNGETYVEESASDSDKSDSFSNANDDISPEMEGIEGHDIAPRPESNILTRMITEKHEHLMNLAKAHMVNEYGRKAALRKANRERIVESSSSSSSRSSSSSSRCSSSDSLLGCVDILTRLKNRIHPLLSTPNPNASGNDPQTSKNVFRNVILNKKKLQLSKSKRRGSKTSKSRRHDSESDNDQEVNRQRNNVGSNNENESDNDDKPCTSSRLRLKLKRSLQRNVTSSGSNSDSPSLPEPKKNTKEVSLKGSNFAEYSNSSCSSSSTASDCDSDSSNEIELKTKGVHSFRDKSSPCISPIKNERRTLMVNKRRKPSSNSSSDNSSRIGTLIPKKKGKLNSEYQESSSSDAVEEIKTENENEDGSDIKPTACNSMNATLDSGIELSRNGLEQENDDSLKAKPCSSRNSERVEKPSLNHKSWEATTPCAFRKNELFKVKKRQYKERKSDSN